MKKIVIYTTIGAVLIILGVYTSASEVSANESITAVNIPLLSELAGKLDIPEEDLENIDDTEEEKSANRTNKILQAILDGKLTPRQSEILDYIEDLVPIKNGNSIFTQLNNVLFVSKDEFLDLKTTMREIGLETSLYI